MVALESENARLKAELKNATGELLTLKEKMLDDQRVHNNRIDKLLALVDKTTTNPPSI